MPLLPGHPLLNATDGKAEKAEDWPHPVRVASGEVVIGGHHMDPSAPLRVPENRGNGCQGLPFAGLHFGDAAVQQCERALDLDVEHVESDRSSRNFGGDGNFFEFASGLLTRGPQGVIAQLGEPFASCIDSLDLCSDRRGNGI